MNSDLSVVPCIQDYETYLERGMPHDIKVQLEQRIDGILENSGPEKASELLDLMWEMQAQLIKRFVEDRTSHFPEPRLDPYDISSEVLLEYTKPKDQTDAWIDDWQPVAQHISSSTDAVAGNTVVTMTDQIARTSHPHAAMDGATQPLNNNTANFGSDWGRSDDFWQSTVSNEPWMLQDFWNLGSDLAEGHAALEVSQQQCAEA